MAVGATPVEEMSAWSLLGYRVDSADGRLGVVEGVRGPMSDAAGAMLVVGRGLFVRATTVVPFSAVAEIAVGSRRIVVRAPGEAA